MHYTIRRYGEFIITLLELDPLFVFEWINEDEEEKLLPLLLELTDTFVVVPSLFVIVVCVEPFFGTSIG